MRFLLVFLVATVVLPGQHIPPPVRILVSLNTTPGARPIMLGMPPSPLKLQGYSLRELVAFATNTPSYEVVGGPSWADTDRWDVQTENQNVLMGEHPKVLLGTLGNQFGLRTHNDTKVMPVYELTVTSTGPKMPPDPFPTAAAMLRNAIGNIHRRNSTVKEFADILARHLGKPIIDNTGLTDLFLFDLDWAPDPSERPLPEAIWGLRPKARGTTPKPGAPPIAQAVQEQLGLSLTPKQTAITVLIIDQANKPRTR